jgi:hypothetical protein
MCALNQHADHATQQHIARVLDSNDTAFITNNQEEEYPQIMEAGIILGYLRTSRNEAALTEMANGTIPYLLRHLILEMHLTPLRNLILRVPETSADFA